MLKVKCIKSYVDFRGHCCFFRGLTYEVSPSIETSLSGGSYKKENIWSAHLRNGGAFVIKSLQNNRLDSFFNTHFEIVSENEELEAV